MLLLLYEAEFEADTLCKPDFIWFYSLQLIMVGNHAYDNDLYLNRINKDLTYETFKVKCKKLLIIWNVY